MRSTPPIRLLVAATVAWLTAGSAAAQPVPAPGQGPPGTRAIVREGGVRAPHLGLLSLANQLRPFYRYELMHVRAACALSTEELRRIRPQSDAAYEEAIDDLHDTRTISTVPLASEVDPDYAGAIRKAVYSVVERQVSRERWARLQADDRARAAGRREVGVELLVAEIDRRLLLVADQRRRIAAALASHWDDRWSGPMEAAFAQESRYPDLPDALLIPHLSEEQVRSWRDAPKVRGELWGVTIDHGGDPAMDRELGGDGHPGPNLRRNWVFLDAPPNAVTFRPVPAVPIAPRVVLGRPLVVQQPMAAARPPVPAEEDDDPEEQAAQAEKWRQQRIAAIARVRQVLFEQRVFAGERSEADFRREAEAALASRLDYIGRVCRLDEPRRRKLHAAGHGDLKRFLDRVDEARRSVPDDGDPRTAAMRLHDAAAKILPDAKPLLTAEGPLLAGVLARTLTEEQRAALEQDPGDRLASRLRAGVRWTTVLLARSLGLTEDRRRRLEAILLERVRPPRKFDSFDYTIVMYQASRIPEREIRPIFDDLQWRVMTDEFAAIRRWGLHLKQGRFLPAEMFGDDPGGRMAPIRILTPAR